jgi:CBS domain-containing protein
MQNRIVADVMTREPVIVKPDINLLDCAKKMVRKRVGSLLLVEKKKLVGFISEKDILWALIKKSKDDLSKIKAIEISPKKIATIKPTATISETIEKMKKVKFERLPVINNGELMGIITTKDILNFHPEFYPELDEFSKVREQTEKLKRIKKSRKGKIGICEACGKSDVLQIIDGNYICEICKNKI